MEAGELIKEMLAVNQVAPAEVISVILTSTPDLISCHPGHGGPTGRARRRTVAVRH